MAPVRADNTVPNAKAQQAAAAASKPPSAVFYRNFKSEPPIAVGGKGIEITLADGRTVIDAIGGAAVACIGNGHPKVIQAIKDQADKLSYVYNAVFTTEPAEQLAQLLVDRSENAFDLVGFFSGGTEAVESALKLARQYYWEIGQKQRVNFIGRRLAYHGNSLGTLSIAQHPTRRVPYEGVITSTNFHHVSPAFPHHFQSPDESQEHYVQRLAKELNDKFNELGPETVVGFIAETVVGATTGAVLPPKGYFPAMKAVCEKHGALFILDEVMCGVGRTGTFHAWQGVGDGAAPDIQAIAKGLGGGYQPIGACLVAPRVSRAVRDGSGVLFHGHTYQCHPIACAAALAVQQVLIDENLVERAQMVGSYLGERLKARVLGPEAPAELRAIVSDVRGAGCLWAVEFNLPGSESMRPRFADRLVATGLERHRLSVMGFPGTLDGIHGDHVVVAPAYIVSKEQVEEIVDRFVKSSLDVLEEMRGEGWKASS